VREGTAEAAGEFTRVAGCRRVGVWNECCAQASQATRAARDVGVGDQVVDGQAVAGVGGQATHDGEAHEANDRAERDERIGLYKQARGST
jgi:hypothetical protein